MARIQAFPLEMLALVLTFVVRRHFDDKNGAEPPTLRLRAVCRLCRDAVNADPSLWKIIPLHNTAIAREFVSRSRTRPLLVYLRGRFNALNSNAKQEAFDVVLQRAQQVGSPSLVDLIRADQTYGRAMECLRAGLFPQLRALEMLRTDCRPDDGIFVGPVPWHLHTLISDLHNGGLQPLHGVFTLCPLTIMELGRMDISALALTTLLDVLSGLPNLQKLMIEVTDHREPVLVPRHTDRSVALPCLRKAEFAVDLPYLPLLLRPLGIPSSAKMLSSCLHRHSGSRIFPEDDFRDLKAVQHILRVHFSPILSQDFRFTKLTLESKLCGRRKIAGVLILSDSQASELPDMPDRLVFECRLYLPADENVMDRALATFPLLLSCAPALERVTSLTVRGPCVLDPPRYSDIFAAAPLIATITVNDIYAKHIFWALQSTFPTPLLPDLVTLALHKIRLIERVVYSTNAFTAEGSATSRGPPITVGDLLLLCLDYRKGHGSEKWRLVLKGCSVLEDHVRLLSDHLPSRFWDGKCACRTLPSLA